MTKIVKRKSKEKVIIQRDDVVSFSVQTEKRKLVY